MKRRTQNPTGCKEENLIKNRERSKTICGLGLIFAFIILGIIIVTTMALAKYVIKYEKDIEVTLRNVRISENEIEIIPSSWTNENVTVSISTKKNGEVYYKINENGEWKKYEKNFEVEENCNIYTKIKYTDGESPETVKEVTNIDKIKPTVEIVNPKDPITPDIQEYTILVGETTTNISKKLIANDEGGSGLKTLSYVYSQSNTTEPTTYEEFKNEATVTKSATGGNWYIWTKVLDNAGNRAEETKISPAYNVGYQISYDANGGTGAPKEQRKVHGTELKISETIPTKTGYEFQGWATTNTATTAELKAGGNYTTDKAVKLYAVWKKYKYLNTTTSKYYMKLSDALNEVKDKETIKAMDYAIETTAPTLATAKAITFDLNGQTIVMSNVTLTNNGTLTIAGTNGTLTGSGADTITNNGTATITAGTVSSTDSKVIYNASANAKLTVSGGSVKGLDGEAIYNYADGTVTVTNGTINATGRAIYNNAGGAVNISGGELVSTGSNTIVNGSNSTGTITISGGTIDNTATDNVGRPCLINYKGNVIIKDNANINSMYARTVLQYTGDGTIDIQGGTITNSSTTQNISCYAVGAESGTVKISGGTISSKVANAVRMNAATINISGGTISTSKGDAIYCNSASSKLNISGGTITTTTSAGISMGYGTLTITGGTVKGNSYGIWTSENKPTVTIGANDGKISVTTPSITSTNGVGLYIPSGVTCNFYDGKIVGTSGKSISGTVTSTATNCVVVKTTSGSTETAVLGPSAPVITAKLDDANGATYTGGTWTNHSVWVQLKSASIGAGIKEYQWYENGAWTTRELTTNNNVGMITYTATRNETIRFRAIDNNGVISYETVLGIKIDKIAPTAPTIEKSYGILPNCSHSVTNLTISGSTYTTTSGDPTISFSGMNKYTNVTGVWVKFNKALEKNLETLQVFYSTGGAAYSEANSKKVGAPAGSTELKVEIPKGTYDNIRVDIGSVSGVSYELSDIYLITTDDIWNNGNIRLVLNSTDANSGIANYQIKYSGSSNSWKDISTTTDAWSAERNETIYYRAVDKAGNVSTESSIPIKIDKTAPAAPTITNSSGGNWTNQSVTTKVTSTDAMSGIAKYQIKYSGTSNAWRDFDNNNSSHTSWSADRNETIYFRAIDNAGNISAESSTSIKIDKTAPTVTFGTNGNTTAAKTASTKVTVTDGGSGVKASSLKYLWTSSSSGIVASNFAGNHSSTFTSGGTISLPSGMGGDIYLWILAQDNLGKQIITKSNKFTVSNIAPEADISVSTTAWTTGNVTMTIKPYAPTVLYDNGYFATTNRDMYGTTFPYKSYGGTKFRISGTVKTITTANSAITTGAGFQYKNKSDAWAWPLPQNVTTGSVTSATAYSKIYTIPTDYKEALKPFFQIGITAGTAGYKVEYTNIKYEYFDYTKIKSVTVNGTAITLTNGVGTYTATANGTYNIVVTDVYGNSRTFTKSVTNIDRAAPTITSAEIKNVTPTGYDVYVYGVKDAGSGVNRVQFPTWTSANGQDDIQSDWVNSTAAKGTKQSDGTTWVYRVNTTAHKNESGTYYTHIYVYDNLGNSKNVSTHTITVPNVTVTYDNNFLANDKYTSSVLINSYHSAGTAPKTTETTDAPSAKYGKTVKFTMNAGTNGGPYYSPPLKLTVGTTYTWSVYVQVSRAMTFETIGSEQDGQLKKVTINATIEKKEWQRLTYTFTAKDTQYYAFTFYNPSGGWKDGDVLNIHSLELSQVGGLNTTTATKTYGNTLSSLPTPTRTGYTFNGWYTAPLGGTKIATTTAVPSSNTTYYAHWTVNKYYLDLNGNCDGSTVGKINDYGTANVDINGVNDVAGVTDYYKQWPYGTQYAINKIAATTGHTYNGVASGSLTGTITGTTSVSLKFTTNKYNLTFQNVYNTFEVKILSSAGALKHTVNISSSSPTISNILYTDIIQTSTTSVKQTVSGTAFTEVKCSNVPTRTGYTWNSSVKYTMGAENTKAYRWNGTGWYTDHNGDTQCTAFSRLASTNGYTAKLTIGWTVNNYTVTYNYSTNGGTSASKTTASVAYGSNVDLTPTATKSGWTFVGWSDPDHPSGTTKLKSYKMPAKNITLYAIYSKTLTGTFKYYNNQTKTVSTTIYNTATKGAITAPAALGTPSGYTFRHWSTATAANAAMTVAASGSITISANTTYYASYQQTVTATFYYHPGTDQYAISQSSTTAPGTKYMGYTGGIVNGSITIPKAVSESTGIYGTKYAGVSKSTNSLTAASVTTENTTYYAYYDVGVTYYYWNGSKVTASNPSSTRRRALSNGSNYALSATNVPSTTSAYDSAPFKNWTYDLNAIYERTPTSTASTTLYAYYQKSVTATFWYYNNGTASKKAPGTKSYITNTSSMKTINGSISIPSEVSKNVTADRTYTYNGVSTSAAANATPVTPTTANTTYYANYRYSITITFDSNGATSGKSNPSPITGNVYCSYTLTTRVSLSVKMPDNTSEYALVKASAYASYKFSGWNSKSDGTGTQYNANSTYSFSTSTTVYVRWFREIYKNTTTNKTYDILNYAFNEAKTGETIQMLENGNSAEPLQPVVASGKTINLELNGKTINLKNAISNKGTLYINKTSTSGTIRCTGGATAIESTGSYLEVKNATITSDGMGIDTKGGSLNSLTITTKGNAVKNQDNTMTMESCTLKSDISAVNGASGRIIIRNSTITGDYGIFNFKAYIEIHQKSRIEGTSRSGAINYESGGTIQIGATSETLSNSAEVIVGKEFGLNVQAGTVYFYNGRIQGQTGACYGTISAVRSTCSVVDTTSGGYKMKHLKSTVSATALNNVATMSLGRIKAINILKNSDENSQIENNKQSVENQAESSKQPTDETGNKDENSSEKITENDNNIGEYNKEQMDNAKMNAKDVDDYEKEYILLRYEENKYSNNPDELKKKINTEDIENKTLWTDQTDDKLDAVMTNANWKDKYIEFNGETTYGILDKINTKAITIETTILCTKLPEDNDECIIGDIQNDTELLYITKGGYIKAKLKIGENEYEVTSTQKLEENKVYGITLTYDGKNLIIYINGKEEVKIEIKDGKQFFDNKLELIIGAKSNKKAETDSNKDEKGSAEIKENTMSNYFYGNMYTFSIYKDVIDKEKILNNYIYNSKLVDKK